MHKKKLYIAYGSNMHRPQMARRCPEATVIGVSQIPNYTLRFRGSGVATIEPRKGSSVPVVVWEISRDDERNLDYYEGFPFLYTKQDFEIELNEETVTAMAYVITPGRKLTRPSVAYFNTILYGYEDFGFDPNELCRAAEEV